MVIPLPLIQDGPEVPASALTFVRQRQDQFVRYLSRHIAGEVRSDAVTRKLYRTDASIYQVEPLAVVLPRTTADLRTAVEVAGEMRLPITSRGGGTSLSGQAIGPGVVIDCSKYLHAILDLDPTARRVRAQPGVILDQLNRAAGVHRLQFGPDVATATRATVGGMLGNNSAGARSIVYGATAGHTLRLEVLLADGTPLEFGPVTDAAWARKAAARTREGVVYAELGRIILDHADEIHARFPRIPRRVSGYNLLDLLPDPSGSAVSRRQTAGRGLLPLLVGSEGTLAVITEADLALVPRPNVRGLAVPHFDSLTAATDAVEACLELGPSAVELMDHMLLELSRQNLALKDTMSVLEGEPAALLMVEFSGDTPAEVADKVDKLRARLRGAAGVTAVLAALEPARRDPLWNLRSAAVPLLLGLPGDRKPVAFVEDAAVPPARLPEFVASFRDLLARHGTSGAFYGHASVGCLHIRPLINLKDVGDVARMRRISGDVTALVMEFGGCLSGEHGDGFLRSEWNRTLYGPVMYDAFRRVKRAFDPHGLLNPGRVVDAPPMTENLRYGPGYATGEPAVRFDYGRHGGFARAVELCNGNGACRKLTGGAMCPSFRATRDERDSPRGRANALRLALSADQPLRELRSGWVGEVLDLCLSCKACKAECPSNVDVAMLKAEYLNLYYDRRTRPPGHYLMLAMPRLFRLASLAPRLVNRIQSNPLVRWVMQETAGIDRRRSLPAFAVETFPRWFGTNRSAPMSADGVPVRPGRRGRVILLDDCFTNYTESEVGRAAVRVLEAAGYRVETAGLRCCGRPLLSKGFLGPARDLVTSQMKKLARRVSDGAPILGLEPSCLLSLVDEWPLLVPGPETRRIAAAAELADAWLARRFGDSPADLGLTPRPETCVLHGHCHQKALVGDHGTVRALGLIPELTVKRLDAGCCGMAGAFGYEREHYDLSVKIAGLELLPRLAESPDALIVAPGTSCRHQVRDLTGRRPLHPMQVLAAQLPESGLGGPGFPA